MIERPVIERPVIARGAERRPPRLLARLGRDPRDLRASQPTIPTDADGALRRVGVEIEFVGIDLGEAARVVAPRLGAALRRTSEYAVELESEALGTFRLEVDSGPLHSFAERRASGGLGALERGAEELLSSTVGVLTPLELVTPPLAPAFLPLLDDVVGALASAGAVGTQRGPLAAFGVHYNPVPPRLDVTTLWRHLQAYCLLERWLVHDLDVDLSRKLAGWVRTYSRAFVRDVVDGTPPRSARELVERYLDHNPGRNHALDLLPLLAHLDRERVATVLEEEPDALSVRPTFHFRLPDSLVGEDTWSVTRAWRHWLVVEDLACDARRLHRAVARSRERGWTGGAARLSVEDVEEVLA